MNRRRLHPLLSNLRSELVAFVCLSKRTPPKSFSRYSLNTPLLDSLDLFNDSSGV